MKQLGNGSQFQFEPIYGSFIIIMNMCYVYVMELGYVITNQTTLMLPFSTYPFPPRVIEVETPVSSVYCQLTVQHYTPVVS